MSSAIARALLPCLLASTAWAAPVERIEVALVPTYLTAGQATTIAINARVIAVGGQPSDGTTVSFSVATTPEGSAYSLFPQVVTIDSDGKATSALTLPGTVLGAKLTVKATPPTVDGQGPPAVVEEVQLRQVP